ncbi:substrate-binding domain-containing protein [Cellulomonas edaphi]|uniref:Sugar ABC transporter substrate-binding protein n=1 Tax=Cellulomonas edaphi TaxID=3053468 RepID=A0ABT7SA26_9CELL|nr:sugar-binding protein [Cellulomons edaphi]MDM7832475.1 sugar ABC transporter substrate-binding protein [Cellulomons edaphi]
MKKIAVALIAASTVGALALTGCSSDDRDSEATPTSSGSAAALPGFPADATIGVALPQKTSENWVLAEQLFNDGLKDAGFKPIVQFGNSGVPEQQNQIQAMTEQGAKVIVVGAIDGSQLGSQLQAAKDAGAYIIAYDRLVKNTPAVDQYIAFDNFKVGELQGQALLDGLGKLKGDKPYNIELVAGSPDDANATPFFEGAMSILQPKIDDGTLKVVSGQTTFDQVATQGWKAENVQKRFDTIMSANYADGTELQGVLSPNDTLARGVLTSVKQAGQTEVPVITGQDSEVESVKLIMQGVQYSTIYKDTRELVAETIKAIQAVQKGEQPEINDTKSYNNGVKVVPSYLLEPKIVTKDNAAEVYANDATLAPLTK